MADPEYNGYETKWVTRADWRDYPGELERPQFAHMPSEIDWQKLYELRKYGKVLTRKPISPETSEPSGAEVRRA